MRVLVLGDTHGEIVDVREAYKAAKDNNCDAIVQLGDFGFWPRQMFGPDFIKGCSRLATEHDIPLYWVAGNHECFKSIHEQFGRYGDSPVEHADGVYYLPFGHTWEWEGVKMMAMGGAASIDRRMRTISETWFPEELINDEDVSKAQDCDIIFSHDSPVNPLEIKGHSFVIDEDSEFCRQQMRKIVSVSKPDLVMTGHYHIFCDSEYLRDGGYTRVVNLDCNGWMDKAVLDLKDGKFDLQFLFRPGGEKKNYVASETRPDRYDAPRLVW